jgi:nucleoside-diphosphate-sugar epimerase
MNVTVTGAVGRLGTPVCRTLAGGGHVLRATDKASRPELTERVEVADLLNRDVCNGLMRGAETVVHLANHPDFRLRDPQLVFNENVTMNMNVFQAAADAGVKKIVFASSVQVISGITPDSDVAPLCRLPYLPLDGDVPPNPANPYALSKHVSETMLAYFARVTGMCCIAVRFPWLMNDDQMAAQAAGVKASHKTCAEAFTYLHLRDAATLVKAIVEAPLTGFRRYLPAARDDRSRQPAAAVIREHYPDIPLRRPLDQIDSLVDISTIERETGWSPQISFPPLRPD